MGEVAVSVLKWIVRGSVIIALALAFIVLYNYILSFISVTLNQSIIYDLVALIQIWLPFNLSVLLLWVFTATSFYLGYRVTVFAVNIVNTFVGTN